jgi:hypothetical protein
MSEPENDYNWNHIAANEADFTSSFADDFAGEVILPEKLLEELTGDRLNSDFNHELNQEPSVPPIPLSDSISTVHSPTIPHVGISGNVSSCDTDSYVHKTHRHHPPQLSDELTYLKGVGPQRAELLLKFGLRRAADLLFYFPRDYVDLTDRRGVEELV